jgi:hypothetical protein
MRTAREASPVRVRLISVEDSLAGEAGAALEGLWLGERPVRDEAHAEKQVACGRGSDTGLPAVVELLGGGCDPLGCDANTGVSPMTRSSAGTCLALNDLRGSS